MAMTEIAAFGLRLNQFSLFSSISNRDPCNAFPCNSVTSKRKNPNFRICSSSLTNETEQQGIFSTPNCRFTEDENRLVEALIGIQGRGRAASPQQLKEVELAVQGLEDLKGVPDPTSSSLIEGQWRLMFTTRPGTASPIQMFYLSWHDPSKALSSKGAISFERTFVGVDFFTVFQEVYLQTNDPRVSNIVKFSDAVGELKVEAVASVRDGKRILFQFDRAAFSLKFLPFKVPYPVPFRLLGDEAQGWLDTTYLSNSGNLRISRGNKGTTFVLQKEIEPRQELLSAISTGTGVTEAIDKLISTVQDTDGEPPLLEGEWKMIWSSQVETDSWLENAANGLMGTQIIKKDGQLRFLVDIVLGLRFSMTGAFQKTGSKTYDVKMDDPAIIAGSFGLPINMGSRFILELLYADDKIRITRGYNKIMFVHLRM